MTPTGWDGLDSAISHHVEQVSRQCLAAYRENPLLVREHANIERAIYEGGYEHRQIYELVQNGADEMLEHPGKVEVVLTEDALYCANQGRSVSMAGVESLLGSNLSQKRGFEIGRFGVGFKSVLRISNEPLVVSRSGSFAFSLERSHHNISAVVPGLDRYPILRVAQPIDAHSAFELDPVLNELGDWATTVIKLPLVEETGEWLGEDLANFPAEFVLFASHVAVLTLQDRRRRLRREISRSSGEGAIELREGANVSRWKIFEVPFSPSQTARKDAGELADRETLPLHWAVPLEGRTGRGRFWAFFPTHLEAGVTGILNAPWKTNVDRQHLLPSKINDELLKAAANLVIDCLPALIREDDPGWVLSLLPGRIDESAFGADRTLNNYIYQLGHSKPSVPNQDGTPTSPVEMHLSPFLPEEAYSAWAEFPDRPRNWPHASCESRERRSRMQRLFGDKFQPASAVTWLEALAKSATPRASIAALKVVAILWRDDDSPSFRTDILNAKVLLTSDGNLVAPIPSKVFLPVPGINSAVTLVHSVVAADEDTADFLRAIGLLESDHTGEYRAFVADGFQRFGAAHWARFWDFARAMPDAVAVSLRDRRDLDLVCLRTCAGEFLPRVEVLLPGIVADCEQDPKVAVDATYHAGCDAVIAVLKVRDRPVANGGALTEKWGTKYEQEALDAYYAAIPKGMVRPQPKYIGLNQTRCAGPLEPLYKLSIEGKARFTAQLLGLNEPKWSVSHQTRSTYPVLKVEPPSVWIIRRHGILRTSLGLMEVARCVSHELRRYERFLAVILPDVDAGLLDLPAQFAHISKPLFAAALQQARDVNDPRELGAFYLACSEHIGPPSQLACVVGHEVVDRSPSQIAVVWSPEDEHALLESAVPFVAVESEGAACRLIDRWRLRLGTTLVKTTVAAVPVASEIPATKYFPALKGLGGSVEQCLLSPCSELRLETLSPEGKRTKSVTAHLDSGILYYIAPIDDAELLDSLCSMCRLDLAPEEKQNVLEHRERAAVQRRLQKIRSAPTLAARLLEAVGESRIRKHLPLGLIEAVQADKGNLKPDDVAELAFAVYGVDILREFNEELVENGFDPPSRWAGSTQAIEFAATLGFPKEFSGFESARRDALMQIDGPPRLPDLHDFQRKIAANLKELATRRGPARGLLCLPTGAGKTRVAVEALIDCIIADKVDMPLIWIAQSDELCEQAVQSWAECWRAFGDKRVLAISRLWSTNRAHAIEKDPHVIVATIQKLNSCIDGSGYQWLARCGCIVVDEAHGAITPEYTKVLRFLGLDFSSRDEKQDRCPLIGLTATPFRGSSEDETARLVARFGGNRIDLHVLGEDPYGMLQGRGVLAHVDQHLIDGTEICLTEEEQLELKRFRRLPAAVEERLGSNRIRNRSLVESIGSLSGVVGTPWTAILFATSVQHAQVMAALLNFEGISAAAISADTDPGARRHYIERFRAGELNVLTNYGVLTQGFDAPSVRVIYVARPTFSPNVYQQMIGRGLRGPKNGGKERCLIVNVRDNIELYGVQLAFTHFEHLWNRESLEQV